MEQEIREAVEKHFRSLKIQVHNKAVFPDAKEEYAYISLKVFDSILKNYIDNLQTGGDTE